MMHFPWNLGDKKEWRRWKREKRKELYRNEKVGSELELAATTQKSSKCEGNEITKLRKSVVAKWIQQKCCCCYNYLLLSEYTQTDWEFNSTKEK
jgi:hypothetical protein